MANDHDTVACEVADRIAWLRFNRRQMQRDEPAANRTMIAARDELEFRGDDDRPRQRKVP